MHWDPTQIYCQISILSKPSSQTEIWPYGKQYNRSSLMPSMDSVFSTSMKIWGKIYLRSLALVGLHLKLGFGTLTEWDLNRHLKKLGKSWSSDILWHPIISLNICIHVELSGPGIALEPISAQDSGQQGHLKWSIRTSNWELCLQTAL